MPRPRHALIMIPAPSRDHVQVVTEPEPLKKSPIDSRRRSASLAWSYRLPLASTLRSSAKPDWSRASGADPPRMRIRPFSHMDGRSSAARAAPSTAPWRLRAPQTSRGSSPAHRGLYSIQARGRLLAVHSEPRGRGSTAISHLGTQTVPVVTEGGLSRSPCVKCTAASVISNPAVATSLHNVDASTSKKPMPGSVIDPTTSPRSRNLLNCSHAVSGTSAQLWQAAMLHESGP